MMEKQTWILKQLDKSQESVEQVWGEEANPKEEVKKKKVMILNTGQARDIDRAMSEMVKKWR